VSALSSGAIHIELPGRAVISVESGADMRLLRTVLESLRQRSNCALARGSGLPLELPTCGSAVRHEADSTIVQHEFIMK